MKKTTEYLLSITKQDQNGNFKMTEKKSNFCGTKKFHHIFAKQV